ncbi:EF-P 5-aminopentanol modification-associated protein YfmF [Lacticaseibacillus sp. GG6-2]
MRVQLTQGVNLSVVKTTKFKTTRVAVHFLAPLAHADVSARTLLTSVLETACAAYPTQAELSAQLEAMFGASFGIGVGKEGQLHRVTATLNLLNDQFAQEDLLTQGFALLRAVLQAPLMNKGKFDDAVYQREQHNLNDYLESLNEDRQTQASLGLQKLYFEADTAQAMPSFGTPETLMKVTPKHLVATYRHMLSSDQIEIVVAGNVDADAVLALAKRFDFAPRHGLTVPLVMDVALSDVRHLDEFAPVMQAKLNLGYHVDVDYYGPKHYAALVANELFGGSPQSKLFMNVREKASLAYYASSSLDAVRHLVTVQTGIDAENQQRVSDLIAVQLQQVQAGDFSDALLQVVKDGLISNRATAFDAPQFIARQALLQALLPSQPADLDTFVQGIQAVTKEQVMAAAATFKLQASYCLREGE